jgi:hypothetical protein
VDTFEGSHQVILAGKAGIAGILFEKPDLAGNPVYLCVLQGLFDRRSVEIITVDLCLWITPGHANAGPTVPATDIGNPGGRGHRASPEAIHPAFGERMPGS